jgi:hypothetical protein
MKLLQNLYSTLLALSYGIKYHGVHTLRHVSIEKT